MGFLRQRWDRWGAAMVRPLTRDDEPALRSMLEQDPVASLYATEHLERIGLPRPSVLAGTRTASPFLGVFEEDAERPQAGGPGPRLVGVCWFGANLVPVRLPAGHVPRVAAYVRRAHRELSSLFGPAEPVLGLWAELNRGGMRAFDVRPEQPLLVLEHPVETVRGEERPRRHGLGPVRWAVPGDLERLLPAAAAMFTEEVGYSPMARDPAGYRERVAQGVRETRTVVATGTDGEILFKTDIGLAAGGACQLQGVWLAPRLRGRGLSAPLLREACALIGDRYETISLYVNSYNAPARALYRRTGFRRTGTFATVLF